MTLNIYPTRRVTTSTFTFAKNEWAEIRPGQPAVCAGGNREFSFYLRPLNGIDTRVRLHAGLCRGGYQLKHAGLYRGGYQSSSHAGLCRGGYQLKIQFPSLCWKPAPVAGHRPTHRPNYDHQVPIRTALRLLCPLRL